MTACEHCGALFHAERSTWRWCSATCRYAGRRAIRRLDVEPAPLPIRTLAEVAAAMGISASRAQQLEASALRKLRRLMPREEWR